MKKEDIENIRNPIVRKALMRRCADFMFSYGDSEKHSDHNDRYNEHKTYNDYYDHSDSSLQKKGWKEKKGSKRSGAGMEKTWLYEDRHSDYFDVAVG